jgi:hypothetical protein
MSHPPTQVSPLSSTYAIIQHHAHHCHRGNACTHPLTHPSTASVVPSGSKIDSSVGGSAAVASPLVGGTVGSAPPAPGMMMKCGVTAAGWRTVAVGSQTRATAGVCFLFPGLLLVPAGLARTGPLCLVTPWVVECFFSFSLATLDLPARALPCLVSVRVARRTKTRRCVRT